MDRLLSARWQAAYRSPLGKACTPVREFVLLQILSGILSRQVSLRCVESL